MSGGRRLQAKAFPFCRCQDYSWSSSPYSLSLASVTPLTSVPASTQFCMRLAVQPCDDSRLCCAKLKASLHKISIETGRQLGQPG